jgi:hypothetical protein
MSVSLQGNWESLWFVCNYVHLIFGMSNGWRVEVIVTDSLLSVSGHTMVSYGGFTVCSVSELTLRL